MHLKLWLYSMCVSLPRQSMYVHWLCRLWNAIYTPFKCHKIYIRPSINAQIFTTAVDAAAGSFTVINSNVWLHECAIAHTYIEKWIFVCHSLLYFDDELLYYSEFSPFLSLVLKKYFNKKIVTQKSNFKTIVKCYLAKKIFQFKNF